MPILFLLLAAAQQSAPPAADPPPIVVTGQRLSDTERALKECLARHCPPDQDVAASVAHAENQFVAGRYKDARGTLLAAIGRDRKSAKQYPVPVSGLFRANARIAAHLGEGEAYRLGMIDTIEALKTGLPGDDPRVLMAEIELGDSQAQMARFEFAEGTYARAAARARALGQHRVEGYALLRRASLLTQMAQEDKALYGTRARKALAELIADPEPALAPFGRAARVLQARLAATQGDPGAVDRIIAEYRAAGPTTRPVLLFAEPVDLGEDSGRAGTSGDALTKLSIGSVEDQWIDVGFWIAPDGHATDLDVLRRSPHYGGGWDKAVVKSIKSRRYAPLKLDASDPGLFRVERYTLTARLTDVTGTRIRGREAHPRIEMLDLSVDQPAAPATPAAPAG